MKKRNSDEPSKQRNRDFIKIIQCVNGWIIDADSQYDASKAEDSFVAETQEALLQKIKELTDR